MNPRLRQLRQSIEAARATIPPEMTDEQKIAALKAEWASLRRTRRLTPGERDRMGEIASVLEKRFGV